MLKLVSCDHVISFNYYDKKARNVGLACWYYLSIIMPGNIFYESMRQGITCSVFLFCFVFLVGFFCICLMSVFDFFLRGDTSVFLKMIEMESSFKLVWGILKL